MKEQKRVIQFLVLSLGLCIAWLVLYDFWLVGYDDWMNSRIASASVIVLNSFGYEMEARSSLILMKSVALVNVGPGCNGMVLMALFTGFIIVFPGPALMKSIYIPLGLLLINVLNILRVSTLAINAIYSEHTLEFNHKYTFTLIVYAFIFGLWMLWVKRFSTFRSHTNFQSSNG